MKVLMKIIVFGCLPGQFSYGMDDYFTTQVPGEPLLLGYDQESSKERHSDKGKKPDIELQLAHAIPPLKYLAAEAVHESFYETDADGEENFVSEKRKEAVRVLPDRLMKSSREYPIPFVDYVYNVSCSIEDAVMADDANALAMVLNEKGSDQEGHRVLEAALAHNKPRIVQWFFHHAPHLIPEDFEKTASFLVDDGCVEMVMPATMRVFVEAYATSICDETIRQHAKELLAIMDTGEPVYFGRCIKCLKTGELGPRDMCLPLGLSFMQVLLFGTRNEADAFLAEHQESLEAFSPLSRVACLGREDLVVYLLTKGAEKEAKADKGTALSYACSNQFGAFRTLLAHGAKTDLPDNSPLCKACRSGNVDAVRALLESGADPNIQPTKGRCPLCIAALDNRSDIVQLLLAFGANPCLKNNSVRSLAWCDEETRFLLARAEEQWRAEHPGLLTRLFRGRMNVGKKDIAVGAGSADGKQ